MSSTDPPLVTIQAPEPLTSAQAAAWFTAGTPAGAEMIGYTLSARAATWIRVRPDGAVQHVDGPDDPLAEAYEIVLFDGDRELRWLHTVDGRGHAVALGEDRSTLPTQGTELTAEPQPRRGLCQTRLLAGRPLPHAVTGWTVLASSRYAEAALPLTYRSSDALVIDTVEYLIEDDHGNADVIDTRIAGLRVAARHEIEVSPSGRP